MISLLRKNNEINMGDIVKSHDPTIEVSIEGWEIDEKTLEKAFQTFATAVLGYDVKVEVRTLLCPIRIGSDVV